MSISFKPAGRAAKSKSPVARSPVSQHPLAVYYGQGEVTALTQFERVVLQPGHYTDEDLQQLRAAGAAPLAYLSLGEDVGPAAAWQRPERNLAWYGHYVYAAHPDWSAQLLAQAAALVARGFAGFLLDTLDTAEIFPEDRAAYAGLVGALRQTYPDMYLLANRGFSLLPELAEHVDGVLFEAFSSTWQADGGSAALSPDDLLINTERVLQLEPFGLELFALDYAETPRLKSFARARAKSHGLVSLISNRDLTLLG